MAAGLDHRHDLDKITVMHYFLVVLHPQ